MSKPTDREPDAVYKIGNATVRIYGKAPSREVLEPACIRFMQAVEAAKAAAEGDTDAASA